MTQRQINNKIKETESPEWFKDISAKVKFSHLDIDLNLEGFQDIYRYVSRQKNGWNKISFELPIELKRGKNHFNTLIDALDGFLENAKGITERDLTIMWNRTIASRFIEIDQNKMFTIDSPITTFLISEYKKGSNFYSGAYKFFFQKNSSITFNNSEIFVGALRAYEYQFSDSSDIPRRKGHERSSISRLRNEFEKYFTETQKNVSDFYISNDKKTKEFALSIDTLHENKKNAFDEWFNSSIEKEEEFNRHSLKRAKQLESLYSDKLMLEKPADFWDKRAQKLKGEAKQWLRGLLGAIFFGIMLLMIILGYISEGTLSEIFSSTGTAIKWSVGFIILISFLAFAIRTFSKLSFSAYHLARDAEERKQLVYVYLALKQEKGIEENERILILQSIFSRADSGLLKEDSSPTMPNSASLIERMVSRQN